MLKFARPCGGEHALTHQSADWSPLSQRERAVFLDDCGPLPAGEVADEGAEFQILALSLEERVAIRQPTESRVRGIAPRSCSDDRQMAPA
jgi:hypothetical protein